MRQSACRFLRVLNATRLSGALAWLESTQAIYGGVIKRRADYNARLLRRPRENGMI